MFKIFSVLLLGVVWFGGCTKEPAVSSAKMAVQRAPNEDLYAILAIDMEQKAHYDDAVVMFNVLYEKTEQKEYLYRSLRSSVKGKKASFALSRIDEELKKSPDDIALLRIRVDALLQLGDAAEAKKSALRLVELTGVEGDYLLVSEACSRLREYDVALKYLEGAYIKKYDEKILDKMAVVEYVNLGKKAEAIAHLETHSRLYGCSELVCNRLIGFYSNDNDTDGVISAYIRLYELNKSEETAGRLIQAYAYKKDFASMIGFLESSKIDNELLLQLYMQEKKYDKARTLADKLYAESSNVLYLGQSAVLEYEMSQDKNNKAMLVSVVEKLRKTVEAKGVPMYFNYLGYILIDHNIDIKDGIEQVKKALVAEPNSIYFLDSLAWGYYRLNRCAEAYDVAQKIVGLGGSSNDEILKHIKIIKDCKEKKR